jgi:hypothetical protein
MMPAFLAGIEKVKTNSTLSTEIPQVQEDKMMPFFPA